VKVNGNRVNSKDNSQWSEDLFTKWGETMGRMHSLAKSFDLNGENDGKQWNGNETFSQTTSTVSIDVEMRWNRFYNELSQFLRDRESYGLIHNDLHQENFYMHNGKLILFDFGDCEYNWFAYDIAISLYHAIQSVKSDKEEERREFAYRFTEAFIKGYMSQNALDNFWIIKIPYLLDFRQVFSYIYIVNHLDITNLANSQKQVLDRMKYKIENDVPYVNGFML
jgi:Ser/Thr protein kinase RdoA (MazF antagonist)